MIGTNENKVTGCIKFTYIKIIASIKFYWNSPPTLLLFQPWQLYFWSPLTFLSHSSSLAHPRNIQAPPPLATPLMVASALLNSLSTMHKHNWIRISPDHKHSVSPPSLECFSLLSLTHYRFAYCPLLLRTIKICIPRELKYCFISCCILKS